MRHKKKIPIDRNTKNKLKTVSRPPPTWNTVHHKYFVDFYVIWILIVPKTFKSQESFKKDTDAFWCIMGIRGMMGRDSTACMLHKGRSKPGSQLKMSDCFSVMWATPLKWMSCRLEILGLRLEQKESKRHFGFSNFLATVTSAEMWIQVSSQTEPRQRKVVRGEAGCPILRALAGGGKSNKCKWSTFFMISTAKGAEFRFPSARETRESHFCLYDRRTSTLLRGMKNLRGKEGSSKLHLQDDCHPRRRSITQPAKN